MVISLLKHVRNITFCRTKTWTDSKFVWAIEPRLRTHQIEYKKKKIRHQKGIQQIQQSKLSEIENGITFTLDSSLTNGRWTGQEEVARTLSRKEELLREQFLWACSLQRHKHGAAESNEDDKENNTEASNVSVDDLGESFGVQTCGSNGKKWKHKKIKTENNTGTIPYKRSLLCNFGLVVFGDITFLQFWVCPMRDTNAIKLQ